MAWVRQRGGSYALVESYREHGKVKQRYLRTLTPAEAEAWRAASGRALVATPTTVSDALPAVVDSPRPPAPLAPPDTPRLVVPPPTAPAPRRSSAPTVIPPAWCRMCDVRLPLGGVLCPKCTGALVRRPEPSVCEGCRRRIGLGGFGQQVCCRGCLAGAPHSGECRLL